MDKQSLSGLEQSQERERERRLESLPLQRLQKLLLLLRSLQRRQRVQREQRQPPGRWQQSVVGHLLLVGLAWPEGLGLLLEQLQLRPLSLSSAGLWAVRSSRAWAHGVFTNCPLATGNWP